MEATLRQAARVKLLFPGSASEVYPFRAIPGTEDWDAARALGWDLPRTFREWGECFEWKWHTSGTPLPAGVARTWERYSRTAAFYDGFVTEGSGLARRATARLARWRLARHEYSLWIQNNLFDTWVRRSGRAAWAAR